MNGKARIQAASGTGTVIQTIDPQTMVQLGDAPAVSEVASGADHRLLAALKEIETA